MIPRKTDSRWAGSLSLALRRSVGRAVGEFSLIGDGDRLLLGLSGGKDSLVLLHALSELRRHSPARFELAACTVAIAGGSAHEANLSDLESYCAAREVPYVVLRHPIIDILEKRGERSPCSFCANMRRGILSGYARDNRFGKLALGHSLDDAAETFFMNLVRAGRARSFRPKFFQDRSGVEVIRPLVLTRESAIIAEAGRLELPILSTNCPYARKTERQRVKETLSGLESLYPELYGNVLHALKSLSSSDRWSRSGKRKSEIPTEVRHEAPKRSLICEE
jgi:tRNA(Ile)-lysidine synthase TilS/MesJ